MAASISSYDISFQTLYSNWGNSVISLRQGLIIVLAAQLIFRAEYQYPDDYVTSIGRPWYSVNTAINWYDYLNPAFWLYVPDNACNRAFYKSTLSFDFIVIGAGAGGATVARQLLARPTWRVLLVEAGGDAFSATPTKENIDTIIPQFFPFTMNGTNNVWRLSAKVVPTSSNAYKNGCTFNVGKQLGGSTGINAMLYVCGTDRDYDNWAASGATGWDYNSVLPYIKKSENNTNPAIVGTGTYHGTTGPLTVTNFPNNDYLIPVLEAGFNQLGYSAILDYNSRQYNGFVKLQGTIKGGERMSSYRAMIQPVKNNTNLYIMKYSTATKINFSGTRAVSVTITMPNNGLFSRCPIITATATKEIIVSAGGLLSPKLLQQSGIGKPADLPAGIPLVKNLPVGDNLMDHVYAIHFIKLNPNARNQTALDVLAQGFEYITNRTGPMTGLSTLNAQGIINTTDPAAKYPEIQYHKYRFEKSQEYLGIVLLNFGFKDEYINQLININAFYEILMVWSTLMQPFSRGSVKLNGTNPANLPIITSGYLTDPQDAVTLIRGINKLKDLVATPAMQAYNSSIIQFSIPECDPLPYPSDAYETCYLKYFTGSEWHYSGTCRMGRTTDATTVVDPSLKVLGFTNLRVCDASVMPMVTTGNTQCPTYMIGQKCADYIKAAWP